jgi:excisionase family DNA binding protein
MSQGLRLTIAEELVPVLRRELRRSRAYAEKRFLSAREAARHLGVDRNTTLPELIRIGRIRTVLIGRRIKIPLSELERLETDFIQKSLHPVPSSPSARRRSSPGQTIRALKIGNSET